MGLNTLPNIISLTLLDRDLVNSRIRMPYHKNSIGSITTLMVILENLCYYEDHDYMSEKMIEHIILGVR